jgi:hypothetical protein
MILWGLGCSEYDVEYLKTGTCLGGPPFIFVGLYALK